MSLKPPPTEEDSFIILGTSPGTSLDMKCNGVEPRSLDRTQLDDALKDIGAEASLAFKAHFKLGDCPSPASLMAASTIITDNKTTEELQKSFGEILDENTILKETLKQNNESMKEQFLLIASCQEDMMRTHEMHKEKFDETRDLVEKLRQENKKLRSDLFRLVENEQPTSQPPLSHQSLTTSQSSSGSKSGPSSAMEFVTSPDDDTINKLTAQLELVEKQRRQVLVENEKLTWQKESLEHIVDATTKERDEIKDKIKTLELHLSNKENEYTQRIDLLNLTIQDLSNQLQAASHKPASSEDLTKRDSLIQHLETKVGGLQSDLKNAQLRILELEGVKLEFTKHKSVTADQARMYKEQVQELHNRLKEAQTTVFQPVRFSISPEAEGEASSELGGLMKNVRLYDQTLKHLEVMLNAFTHGAADTLARSLGASASLNDFRLERATAGQVRAVLVELHDLLRLQNAAAMANGAQVKGIISIFEGIFKDYNAVLKKSLTQQQTKPETNVKTLTEALLARGQELLAVKSELTAVKADKEDQQLLKAQLELYKSDFEAEREAREKMACEKENMLTDLRKAQKQNQELLMQLEEVRKLNPNIHKSATAKRLPTHTPATSAPAPATARGAGAGAGATTGNMVYTCPKCMRFSSDQYTVMEDHFDFCLDDF